MHPKPIPSVWINGTFDVLHPGHIKLFRYGRIMAGQNGKVFVGLDADERIKDKKGPSRPINTLIDRIAVLSSIKYIDSVTSFSTDDELKSIIANIKPDFMLIGDDYRNKPIIGSQYIKNIIYITRDHHSTSSIVNR